MQINTLQEKAQNWTKSPLGIFLNNLQWSLASACNILVLFLISAKSGSMPSPPHSQGICVWFSSKGFLHLFFIHHSIRPRGLIVHQRHLIPATSSPSRHSSSRSLSARRWTSFISSWGNLQFGWRANFHTMFVCKAIVARLQCAPDNIRAVGSKTTLYTRHQSIRLTAGSPSTSYILRSAGRLSGLRQVPQEWEIEQTENVQHSHKLWLTI